MQQRDATWVTVRRRHNVVRARRPRHTKTVTVKRCHARMVWRREQVLVKVRRHGKLVRRVPPPVPCSRTLATFKLRLTSLTAELRVSAHRPILAVCDGIRLLTTSTST
jgi:hypothetical protein